MNNVLTINLPYWLEPTTNSFSGAAISLLRERSCNFLDSYVNPTLGDRIKEVTIRALIILTIGLCTAVDLCVWSIMTITVIPAFLAGRSHFINLISFLAIPVLSLGILVGYTTSVNPFRTSHSIICGCWMRSMWGNNLGENDDGKGYAERLINSNVTKQCMQAGLRHEAGKGHHIAVEMFLKEKTEINVLDKYGHTALINACESGNPRIVQLLLDHQADPNLTGKDKDHPLFCAVRSKNPFIVASLLNNAANPHIYYANKITPLITLMMGESWLGPFQYHRDHYPDYNRNDAQKIKIEAYYSNRNKAIEALVEAEVECDSKHLDDVETGLLPALKEADEKGNLSGNIASINNWIDQEEHIQPMNRNPFRNYLNYIDLSYYNRQQLTTYPHDNISPEYAVKIIQENRKALYTNFLAIRPIIENAKRNVIERRRIILLSHGYFNDDKGNGERSISLIISEYVYC